MDIDKLFESDSLDGIADNVFGVVNNSVSEVKEMQRKKVAENVQLVVNALKKIESDISSRYDSVGNALEKRIITIKDGRDGADGRDGRNGKDGKNGRDGAPGPRGADGKNGLDGADGTDGVSVTNAHIDFDGSLVISLSSGQELNVGEVVAPALAEQIKVITNGGGTSQSVIDTLASLQAQITAISGASIYKGLWNASTNTPTLASGVGTSGNFYIVSVAGSTNLDGITNWGVGDWAIYNGTAWQRVEGGAAGNFTTVTASSLTSGRVTYAGTAGLLQDSASLTFDGTTLTSGGFTTTGANATGTLTTTSTAKIGSTVASFMNGTLQVWNQSATNILAQKGVNSNAAPWVFLLKSRGTTPSTNAIVSNNDGTGILGFYGDDGVAGQPTAYISSFVDGVPSANVMPGRLSFLTNGGSTSPTERMRIASTGNTTFLPDGTNTVGTFSSTGLAVTGTLSATGTAATNTTGLTLQGTTTGFNRERIFNTGGDLRFGIDSSVGAEALTGSAAYSSFIGSFTNTPFYLVSNSAIVGTVSSTGLAVNGTLSATGAVTLSGGTANGVAYLNGSKVLTTGSALTFDGTGLGIGTSSPFTKTDSAAARATTLNSVASFNTMALSVTDTTAFAAGVGGGINFRAKLSASTYSTYASIWSFRESAITDDYKGSLIFGTADNADGYPEERMRLDSSGNLLVGTTSSSGTSGLGFKVLANATGAAATAVTDQSTNVGQTNYNYYSTGAGAYRFYVGAGGTIFATSIVISAISDQRLKENVRDIDTGLPAIMALKPRRFDWKEGKGQDKKNAAGFIAQEFQDVFPECVGTSKAGEDGIEYKNINHETLIPTLVKAIQEQQALITALTTRITALEAK